MPKWLLVNVKCNGMIKNYFKTAWRNLLKNKAHSLINISGLSIGMAVAILIGLWIYDELSFDRHFANYNRIAQVIQNVTNNGEVQTWEVFRFHWQKKSVKIMAVILTGSSWVRILAIIFFPLRKKSSKNREVFLKKEQLKCLACTWNGDPGKVWMNRLQWLYPNLLRVLVLEMKTQSTRS